MRKLIPILAVILASVFISACEDEPKTPTEVTQAFWLALENKDIGQLKDFISKKSLEKDFNVENFVSVSNARFGRIIIDGKEAEIETTVTIESDRQDDIELNTQLVQENDKWKVDYQATVDEIEAPGKLSQVIRDLKVLGKQFSSDLSDELESSLNELDKAMPEIENEIKALSEQIKEQVPELKQQFESLAEELQQALEESLSDDEPSKQKSI